MHVLFLIYLEYQRILINLLLQCYSITVLLHISPAILNINLCVNAYCRLLTFFWRRAFYSIGINAQVSGTATETAAEVTVEWSKRENKKWRAIQVIFMCVFFVFMDTRTIDLYCNCNICTQLYCKWNATQVFYSVLLRNNDIDTMRKIFDKTQQASYYL